MSSGGRGKNAGKPLSPAEPGLEPRTPLWVVGKVTDHESKAWEMQGVFSDRNKATGACKDQHYFVGPLFLDKPLPHETCEWVGAFYPIKSAELD